ncbi:MAG: NADP-dependent isocitrate dehydrogenase, partial [Proteobacteria bacterium]
MSSDQTIIYTLTDEAPLLATHAFLPVVSAFAKAAGVTVQPSDISVAARILAAFPELLTPEQQVPDALVELGKRTLQPETNIIKLPNISASVSQLEAAIKELQEKGYPIPDYPADAKTDEQK